MIQFYDQYGIIEKQYLYVFGEDIDEGYEDGWYEEDMDTYVEKVFDVGEAFNVYAAKAGSLQFAGQVLTAQTVVPVRKNISAQGNFRPTGVNIQDITPAVDDGYTLESGDFVIQFYDQYGIIEKQYLYVFGEDIDEGYEDGWYEEDMDTFVEKIFAAGEGFNVYAAKPGTLTFPALAL